jgi:ketosteroid isomerase-like protein
MGASADAIVNVLCSWALGYDERDVDRMASCFTDDATMTLEIPGQATMGPYVGHAEVMRHFTDHHEIQTDQRRHIVANPIVEMMSDESAKTTSLLTLLVTDDDGVRVQATGVYRDHFVVRDGSWQIEQRHLRLDAHY